MLGHPAVREAAVIAGPTSAGASGRWPAWSCRTAQALELGELRAWLEGRVPPFWLPDDLVVLDELPKTGVGKLDKRALRAGYAEQAAAIRP